MTNDKVVQGGHVYDLDIRESIQFKMNNGTVRTITLLRLHESRDKVRGVICFPCVTVDAGQSHITFEPCAGARYELRAF